MPAYACPSVSGCLPVCLCLSVRVCALWSCVLCCGEFSAFTLPPPPPHPLSFFSDSVSGFCIQISIVNWGPPPLYIRAGGTPWGQSPLAANRVPPAAIGEEREPMRQIACEGLAQINDPKYKTKTETAVKKGVWVIHILYCKCLLHVYKFTVFCSETFLWNISYRKKVGK